ncbi:MAG: hypothetical protein ACYC5J_18220, partial [Chloroflexota bacterium]
APVNLIGETASAAQVAEAVRRLAARHGLELQLLLPEQPPAVPDCSFSSALSATDFAPRVSLEEGLERVMEFFE